LNESLEKILEIIFFQIILIKKTLKFFEFSNFKKISCKCTFILYVAFCIRPMSHIIVLIISYLFKWY